MLYSYMLYILGAIIIVLVVIIFWQDLSAAVSYLPDILIFTKQFRPHSSPI